MDWSLVQPFISRGRMPNFRDPAGYRETIISEAIARCLGLDTVGGYSTQLTDFDARYIFARMTHLQRVNGCDSTKIGGYEVHVYDFIVVDFTHSYCVDCQSVLSSNM